MSCLNVDTDALVGKSNDDIIADNLPSNKKKGRLKKLIVNPYTFGITLIVGLGGLLYYFFG